MDHRKLSWPERGNLWLRLGLQLIITAAVILLLVYVAPPLLSFFMPFVLALILAWILNPAIRAIQRRLGVSRKIISAILIVLILAVVGGLLAALVYNIVSEVAALVNNWSSIWTDTLQPAIGQAGKFFSELFENLPDQARGMADDALGKTVGWLNTYLPTLAQRAGRGVGGFAVSIPKFTVSLFIFLMASFFITSDYPRMRFLLLDKITGSARVFLQNVKGAAKAAFGGYVKAQVILSTVIFFILLVGFLITGQPYSVILALFLAVVDFIPILGVGTVMIPWIAVDLLTAHYRHAVEFLILWAISNLFRRFAEPKILGDQTGLSPFMALVSTFVGMRLGGILGMILGPIVCMVILNILKLGIFKGVAADLRLAAMDISAILKNRPALPDEKDPPKTP